MREEILMQFGALCMIIIIVFLTLALILVIKEQLAKLLLMYKIKNRGKKKPIADCYCIDCNKYENKTGICWEPNGMSKRMNNYGFCCFADPINELEKFKKE